MAQELVSWLQEHNIPEWLIPFVISLFPILELRGGIIAASLLNIPFLQAVGICILGNIIPIPFILLFIKQIFKFMKKHNILKRFIEKLEEKSYNRSDAMKKGEFFGLLLFVGIPLPGTGGWTGALIAALLNIDLKKSVPAIFLGILLAAAIMSVICYAFPSFWSSWMS